MKLFRYGNFITKDNEDTMDDLIFNQLSIDNHYPNDERVASEKDNYVEEIEVNSPEEVFNLMETPYTFVEHIGQGANK